MNQRIKSLAKKLGFNILSSYPITKEASYREYFRIKTSKGSFILCYLDPNLGSQKNFLRIYKYLDPSIRPNILASNLEQGITIQEDLGNFDLYDVWEYVDQIPTTHKIENWLPGVELFLEKMNT